MANQGDLVPILVPVPQAINHSDILFADCTGLMIELPL
jgi:hypothetical protein